MTHEQLHKALDLREQINAVARRMNTAWNANDPAIDPAVHEELQVLIKSRLQPELDRLQKEFDEL